MTAAKQNRGKFITFEGIEGSGKTTNINFAATILKEKNFQFITTREPGGTKIGEKIRAVLLADSTETITPKTELLLLFAARMQHIEHVILPSLAAGTMVLCDRFTDASYAYQGGGRNVSLPAIEFLERFVQQDLSPDLTIIFDVPVMVGLERIKARKHIDRIEQENVAFFERVRQGYLSRAAANPLKYKIIDAQQSLEQVQLALIEILTA